MADLRESCGCGNDDEHITLLRRLDRDEDVNGEVAKNWGR
jgi:hypothetical protein